MRTFTRIVILFYVMILSVLCGIALLFVTHIVTLAEIIKFIELAYDDMDVRTIVGVVNAALIVLSFLFARIIYGSSEKERTIAFDNPSGRVTVSLAAMEDMVRRVILRIPDIKEVKTGIIATKKSLEVEIRLILRSDINIPEMTAQLQEMVKNKIQDSIGIEEAVVVRIHVIKITTDDAKAKKTGKGEAEERSAPTIPFQGYRA